MNSTQQSSQQPHEGEPLSISQMRKPRHKVRLHPITIPRMHGLAGVGPGSEPLLSVCHPMAHQTGLWAKNIPTDCLPLPL